MERRDFLKTVGAGVFLNMVPNAVNSLFAEDKVSKPILFAIDLSIRKVEILGIKPNPDGNALSGREVHPSAVPGGVLDMAPVNRIYNACAVKKWHYS
jgi:hypothetical protein